jgi:hypothetical protein
MAMRLTYDRKDVDGRQWQERDILDDTERVVGSVSCRPQRPIEVSLFGGKYAGRFHTELECYGFVQGVETVLFHMLHMK